tara:strand:- start:11 stop:163 length:153 start_codon:yes stop_codon:yes gene_type:complete
VLHGRGVGSGELLQQSCHSAAFSPLEHVDAAPARWRGAGGRTAEGQNGFA